MFDNSMKLVRKLGMKLVRHHNMKLDQAWAPFHKKSTAVLCDPQNLMRYFAIPFRAIQALDRKISQERAIFAILGKFHNAIQCDPQFSNAIQCDPKKKYRGTPFPVNLLRSRSRSRNFLFCEVKQQFFSTNDDELRMNGQNWMYIYTKGIFSEQFHFTLLSDIFTTLVYLWFVITIT